MGGIGSNGSKGSGRHTICGERLCSVSVTVLPKTRRSAELLAQYSEKSLSRMFGSFLDKHIGLLEDEVILETK